VEVLRCLLDAEHRDIGRELRVQRLRGAPRRRAALDVDGRDVRQRVDARVGAPRDGKPVPAREDVLQARAELAFDGPQAGLRRPPVELGSVVLEGEL
jgi:hypothetical protein